MSRDENCHEMVYRELREFSDDEITRILEDGETNDLYELPFSVGEYHPNWKYAQDICVKLATHPDIRVRANAMMGLAYVARTKGKLEKHVVEPLILHTLSGLKDNEELQYMVLDAIDDINHYMKWNIQKSISD